MAFLFQGSLWETAGLLSKHTRIWGMGAGELKCIPKQNDCQGGSQLKAVLPAA